MLKMFYPDKMYESTYEIDYEKLYKDGYRGIIFDIDNTLVPHGAPADKKTIEFFKHLRAIGFRTMLLSNNKEPRVKSFHNQVGGAYIFKANKPSKENYLKAMKIMNTEKKNTLFIGDQLFTDIFGAKKTGITCFLVKPIHPKEEIQIVFKRYLEKIVLWFYQRQTGK